MLPQAYPLLSFGNGIQLAVIPSVSFPRVQCGLVLMLKLYRNKCVSSNFPNDLWQAQAVVKANSIGSRELHDDLHDRRLEMETNGSTRQSLKRTILQFALWSGFDPPIPPCIY